MGLGFWCGRSSGRVSTVTAADSSGGLLEKADLRDTARLLYEVFHAPQFADERYLEWFYRQNPIGPAIETDWADDQGRLGHIGGIPHEYHSKRGVLPAMFPLNVAVHERSRGKGIMAKLTGACYAETRRRWGSALLVGMANDNSVAFYTSKGGYRCVMQMPVRLCPALWPALGRVRSRAIDAAYLASAEFTELVDSLDLEPTDGWSQKYSKDVLAWRLAKPDGRYAIHVGADVVVVTCPEKRNGMPFTVVLKAFRRHHAKSPRPVANGVIAAACRYRFSPLAVHAGFSAKVRILGARVPERYKPAPLHLCVSSQPPGFIDLPSFEYDTFEFLDFDVY